MQNIIEKLTPIFHDVFDDDDLVPTPTMKAADVAEWDSLSHIRLIVAVERAWNIKFTVPEITALEDVGQFAELIQRKTRN